MSIEVCTLCGTLDLPESHEVISETQNRKVVRDGVRVHFLLVGRKRSRAIKAHGNGGVLVPETIIVSKAPPVVEVDPAPVAPIEEEVVTVAPPTITPASDWVNEIAKPLPVEPPEMLFQPDQEGWFTATVKAVFDHCVIAALDNDEDVVIPFGTVTKAPGNHRCQIGFPRGTQISLRMKRTTGKCPYASIEAYCDDAPTHIHERAVVTHWATTYGTVRRPCGCFCFSWLPKGVPALTYRAGDEVDVVIEPSDTKGWTAVIQLEPLDGKEF